MDYEKTILVNGENFTVRYFHTENKNAVARVREKTITIKLPLRWPQKERLKAADNLEKRIVRKLLNPRAKINPVPQITEQQKKIVIKARLPDVVARINVFNSQYFNSQLGRVRIKRNLTNWGSCSPKNNININFALLFMPQKLMDYVIVHELAHTKVKNHSNRFWQIVEKILPDYKARKKEVRKYLLTN